MPFILVQTFTQANLCSIRAVYIPGKQNWADVTQRPSSERVEAGLLSDPNNMGQIQEGQGGYDCPSGECTARSVVLYEPPGFFAIGPGRLLPLTVAQGSLVCLSTSSSDSPLISTHSGRGTDSHSGGSGMHKRVMVPITDSAAVRETVAAPVAQGRTLPAGWCDPAHPSDRPAVMGLAPEWEHLERLDLPPDVVHTIQGTKAPSTTASYSAKWSAFQHWCVERNTDPTSCRRAASPDLSLRFLSLKTALLIALTSAKRVSDLCALSVSPSCLICDGSSAVLRPNPAFMSKKKSSFRSRAVSLNIFFLPLCALIPHIPSFLAMV